ncbi:TolC family protein [Chryseobacterium sp. POL2]|uniref:TolC family protein n=1 Tax=Chryseobacterium sp. POL2 TaxID=2713414 RepID=UPI001E2DDAC4|nr:TolC family protein [Chryseobacterium sp. POL2]
MKRVKYLLFVVSTTLLAQQNMTIRDCEASFEKNNLQLLAQQYNISMSDADIIQAKIWELPQASVQFNTINPEDKKIFDVGRSKEAQISQLIYLGGKKKNEIAFAKSNKELAQLQFTQLLVDLRTQLRTNFYNLYFEKLKLDNITRHLGYMNDLLSAYKIQTKKGNISLKDEVRLQTEVIQLRSDKVSSNNSILEYQQNLKLLTGITENIDPEISETEAQNSLLVEPIGDIEDLKRKALEYNVDYLYNLKLIDNGRLYAQWQKSLNTPDINLGMAYSQNGGTFKNEVDMVVGMPIPLWKSNKGNVEKAKFAIEQHQKNAELQKLSIENQVESAYQTWKNNYQQYFQLSIQDLDDLNIVYNGMLKNFRNGNVSLIDFTDFMDSYRKTILQVYEMKKQIIISKEQLNQLVQTQIFY